MRVDNPELRTLETDADGRTRHVALVIPVTEGPRYRIGEVAVVDNKAVKTEAITTLLKLKKGEYYSEESVRKGLDKARELYGAIGHFEFTAYPEFKFRDLENAPKEGETPPAAPTTAAAAREVAPGPAIVDVTMHMQEGEQYFVHHITFEGNTTTKDKVIRREMRVYESGVFNTEALKYSIRRINQLGYFKAIEEKSAETVKVEKTPHETNKVDVTLKLEEHNRNELTFGGGVSGIDGFYLSFSYATTNFLGQGETFQVSAQRGARANIYQVSVNEPYLFDRPISAGASIFSRKIDYLMSDGRVGYSEVRTGSSVSAGRPLRAFMNVFTSYAYEVIDSAVSDDLDLSAGDPLFVSYLDEGRHIESRASPTFVYNTVDHPLMPRRGMRDHGLLRCRRRPPRRHRQLHPARRRGHPLHSAHAKDIVRTARAGRLDQAVRRHRGAALLPQVLPRRREPDSRLRHSDGRSARREQPRARRRQVRALQRRVLHRHRRSGALPRLPRRRPGLRRKHANQSARAPHLQRRRAALPDARHERAVPPDLCVERLPRRVPAGAHLQVRGGNHVLTPAAHGPRPSSCPRGYGGARGRHPSLQEVEIVRMVALVRGAALPLLVLTASLMTGCQSPSEDESIDVDDFLETTASPSPTNADASDGRTYRVVRGNNQPDEILAYDWHSGFGLAVRVNNNVTSDDLDFEFPISLTSATVKVQQASGGIVSPPTGGEIEHYESVTSQVSGNQFNGANETLTMYFDVLVRPAQPEEGGAGDGVAHLRRRERQVVLEERPGESESVAQERRSAEAQEIKRAEAQPQSPNAASSASRCARVRSRSARC